MSNLNEVAIVVSNDTKANVYDVIDAITEAGFKNVFVQWYDKQWDISQQEQLDYIKQKGLNVIFAHLGYQTLNNIWIDDPIGDLEVERYKKDILDCHNNGINLVVMHACCKSTPPAISKIGIERFKQIADYAQELNVSIGFENTKVKGYVEALLDNIDNNNIGICYDVGHCHAHFKDDWDLSRYLGRIICVHMHDNDGVDDLHLLPFDGTNDWNKVVERLKSYSYQQHITLETVYHRDYVNQDIKEFYKLNYQLANKIKDMFNK